MTLSKYESNTSCPIPCPKNPKSKSWRCPAKCYIPAKCCHGCPAKCCHGHLNGVYFQNVCANVLAYTILPYQNFFF